MKLILENETENKEDLSKKITNLLKPENEEFLKSGKFDLHYLFTFFSFNA